MSTDTVRSAPNLEYYRKQAKALLKAVSANDPAALSRVLSHLPNTGKHLLLADAQWVIARENGFPSWPKFRSHLETAQPAFVDPKPTPAESHEQPGPARSAIMGTDAVFAKTGRHWAEWFALLDAAGCASMSHQQIVAVAREQGLGSWWQQMVTVQYERERGLRDKNMNCYGDYNVGVSRTLDATISAVFQAWSDPSVRDRWLPDAPITIRKSVPCKRILITWGDGGSVTVNFLEKPGGRCQCVADHSKLASSDEVERYRGYWSAALDRLRSVLQE